MTVAGGLATLETEWNAKPCKQILRRAMSLFKEIAIPESQYRNPFGWT